MYSIGKIQIEIGIEIDGIGIEALHFDFDPIVKKGDLGIFRHLIQAAAYDHPAPPPLCPLTLKPPSPMLQITFNLTGAAE